MSNEIVRADAIQAAIERYNTVVEFTKTVLKEGRDYGRIPGTDKPTLLKPGAEKLCSLFRLRPRFELIDKIVDFDKGLFYFQYRCELYHNDEFVAQGNGSCNSRESKYRYRWQRAAQKPSREEADSLKAQGVGRWRKINGEWVWFERVENTEPFELVNTIDKMAQKRALIAATLIAVNASEFFTQDVEDMGIIEAEFVDVEPEPAPTVERPPRQSKPQPVKRQQKPKQPERPFAPEALREMLAKTVAVYEKTPPTGDVDGKRGVIVSILETTLGGKTQRYELCDWLLGEASTKKWTPAQVAAVWRWLKPEKDDETGDWLPCAEAIEEARAAHREALKANGQVELIPAEETAPDAAA